MAVDPTPVHVVGDALKVAIVDPWDKLALRVRVTDFDIPFWSLVKFMVKVAFASLPALIVVWGVGGMILLFLLGFTGIGSGR